MNLILMILAAVVVAFVLAVVIVKFVPLKMRWLFSLLLLGAAIFLGWKIYDGIMKPIKFDQNKKLLYAKVIDNIKLIRDAEVKYKEVYGTYTKDKSALLNFIETGKLAITETTNVEEEVDKGGGIMVKVSKRQIDTTGYEPVINFFKGKDYKNMYKVPGTDQEFSIQTSTIEKIPGLVVPVFQARVGKEFILKGMDRSLVKRELEAVETDQIKGAFVTVGSLEEVSTGGNWPPYYDKPSEVAKK